MPKIKCNYYCRLRTVAFRSGRQSGLSYSIIPDPQSPLAAFTTIGISCEIRYSTESCQLYFFWSPYTLLNSDGCHSDLIAIHSHIFQRRAAFGTAIWHPHCHCAQLLLRPVGGCHPEITQAHTLTQWVANVAEWTVNLSNHLFCGPTFRFGWPKINFLHKLLRNNSDISSISIFRMR